MSSDRVDRTRVDTTRLPKCHPSNRKSPRARKIQQDYINLWLLPPFFQNTSEHFAIRFRQSYLIWEVCDVTAIELNSKE